MLDIGWSEMAVIALVALLVIGPKDLPKAMKTAAFWVRKARSLASEFHSGVDQLVREAELEEARDAIRNASRMNVDRALESTIDPTGEVNKALQPPVEGDLTPAPSPVVRAEVESASPPPVTESHEPEVPTDAPAAEPTKSEPTGT